MNAPGELVRNYATLQGWRFAEAFVMVEGDSDVEYFSLASAIYFQKTGRELVGARLSVVSAGSGDHGGADGVQREFPVLRRISDLDVTPRLKRVCRAVALLDCDAAGKRAAHFLTAKHLQFVLAQDVFLLNRVFPLTRATAKNRRALIDDANQAWRELDCEIEDLLPSSLVECFLGERPEFRSRFARRIEEQWHYDVPAIAKASLFRFVRDNALFDDLSGIIGILKALRLYLELDPEGDP
jgi:hypothetical protein